MEIIGEERKWKKERNKAEQSLVWKEEGKSFHVSGFGSL